MEAACGGGGRSGGGWAAMPGPEFRKQVVDKIAQKLSLLHRVEQHACFQFASNLELTIISETQNTVEYFRKISSKIAQMERPQPGSVRQQQMQMMGNQQLLAHPVQAAQVGNSYVPAMPQAAGRVASQLQGTANVKQQQYESIPMPDHTLNSQPGATTQSAPISECRNQPGQRVLQSDVNQTQSQAQCNPARVMLQNAATAGPNAQQIQVQRQMQMQRQRQMQMQRNQIHGAQQNNVAGMQSNVSGMKTNVAVMQNNVAGMQISGHPGEQSNQEQIKMSPHQQPMTQPPLQTASDQQSNSPSLSPQTPTAMEPVREVDWKEQLFQNITTLKADYFSELMDLNTAMIQRKLTDEELQSLPEKQAQLYSFKEDAKTKTMTALNFLQIQKSCIDEHTEEKFRRQRIVIKYLISYHRERNDKITKMNASHQSQECHDPPPPPQTPNPPTGCDASSSSPPTSSRDQMDEQEESEETSVSQSMHNVDDTTTPSVDSVLQQNHTDHNDNLAAQAEDEAAVVASKKRPIDRLTDAAAAAHPPAAEVQQINTACFMCLEQRTYYDHLLFGESPPQKRHKTDNRSPLQREINAINDKLIDTVITVVTGDVAGEEDGGKKTKATPTAIKLRFTTAAVSPDVRRLLTSSAGTSLVKETKLSVPADYPLSSPVIDDDEPPQGGMYGEIARAVEAAFRRVLGELPEPRSIEQMARAWDSAVRGVVTEFARRRGGGTFSSTYGQWESCNGDN